ncbi:unnamed protein product [Acanthoscelides obtectus]|uniref:Cytochrome P450 n=1 Tax=Acanthoscelides obtectus TaxID=200917 RepID=A0A9P0KJJ1_ACAOB|nr:unnamed protein product [Acanthoscelides obtectus]CAK1662862.1 Cytochrome P450 4d2 [Acanthoscelides obtectus]
MAFFVALIATFFVGWLCYQWYTMWTIKRKLAWIPEVPGGLPVLGNILDVGSGKDVLNALTKYVTNAGEICTVQLLYQKYIITTDYDFLEFVLSSTKILDKGNDYRFFDDWLGSGLLLANASKWRRARKIITPSFHFSILEQFIDVFEKNGKILMHKLEDMCDQEINLQPYITSCTLDIICESAMGVSVHAQENIDSEYVFAVKDMCRILIARMFSPLGRNNWTYKLTSNYYKEKKHLNVLHSRTKSVVQARRKEALDQSKQDTGDEDIDRKKKLAFLDSLLLATIDGRPLTDDEIREEVDTFMFAGHDTTASAISFCIYLLMQNPEVQAKAFKEQKTIFGGTIPKTVTHRDLQEMKYLECVIKETLRIYPSVPLISRVTDSDIVYKDGKTIPKGTTMILFTYGAHRNPKYFKDPGKFDPSRFESNEITKPFAYLPFSAGPRNCIDLQYLGLSRSSTVVKDGFSRYKQTHAALMKKTSRTAAIF